MLRLSVLDQSIAAAGRPQGEAIRNTVALARHCEALGYARFWVSEHHSHPTILGTAPEIIIAAMAVTTERIRIGAAGVMLPHYSPLKVAEQFRVLDALAPGRVDLGLGRAPGSDGRTAFALNPAANERPMRFSADVADILAWVAGEPLREGHPFAVVRAYPQDATTPEVWVLGSSDYGARVAAHFGLPYCFAWFFTNGRGGRQALELYRRDYRASVRHPEPRAAICVWALAADSDDEARHHFASRALWQIARDRGIYLPLAPAEEAWTEAESAGLGARIQALYREAMAGEPVAVAERIRTLAGELEIDEVAVVTWTHDEAVRRHSYALLAQAFALQASGESQDSPLPP